MHLCIFALSFQQTGINARNNMKTVVVTGFGPFAGHTVNASWESVKELHKLGLGDDVNLVIAELPVKYSSVKKRVPSLWDEHKPDLVVHVGVSNLARGITLEQQAHNDGYTRPDIKLRVADNACCVPGADNCLMSRLDMAQVCEKVNQSKAEIKAEVSHDPGRYLCDFSYYTSLHINSDRAAFIHVPPLDQPFTLQQITQGLQESVKAMLGQLDIKS